MNLIISVLNQAPSCLLLVEGAVGTVLDLSPRQTGLHVLRKVDLPSVILPGFSVTQGVVWKHTINDLP